MESRESEGPAAQPTASTPAPRPAEPGELRPTGRPNARLRQTAADMIRSLALVLGVVAIVLLITLRPQPDPVRVVDPTPVLLSARAEAVYPVVYPQGLGEGWRPTSARWQPTPASDTVPAWHVGFVTPGDEYVQVGQSSTDDADYVVEQTSGGLPAGESAGGWQRYDNGDGTVSLVRVVDGVTVVISGTADWNVLEDVAGRLSPTALPNPAG